MWQPCYDNTGLYYDDTITYDCFLPKEIEVQIVERPKSTSGIINGIYLTERGTSNVLTSVPLVAGDVKLSVDGGALANITTLPTTGTSGHIAVTVSANETSGDRTSILFIDQTSPKLWDDSLLIIDTYQYSAYSSGIATIGAVTVSAILDSVISSSTFSPGTIASKSAVASAVREEVDTNSTKLDVAIGTRLPTSGYTSGIAEIGAVTVSAIIDSVISSSTFAPGTLVTDTALASSVRVEMDSNSTKLDVAVGTRATSDDLSVSLSGGVAVSGTVDARVIQIGNVVTSSYDNLNPFKGDLPTTTVRKR